MARGPAGYFLATFDVVLSRKVSHRSGWDMLLGISISLLQVKLLTVFPFPYLLTAVVCLTQLPRSSPIGIAIVLAMGNGRHRAVDVSLVMSGFSTRCLCARDACDRFADEQAQTPPDAFSRFVMAPYVERLDKHTRIRPGVVYICKEDYDMSPSPEQSRQAPKCSYIKHVRCSPLYHTSSCLILLRP